MEINEIVRKIVRPEENSSGVIATFGVYTVENVEEAPVERNVVSVMMPRANIRGMLDKVMVDLEFKNEHDVDLQRMYKQLADYGDLLNKATMETEASIPIFSLALIPESEEGKCWSIGHNPIMWSLTAMNPGRPISTIRMVFNANDLQFFSADDMDITDVKTQVAIEESKRQNMISLDEQRRQERLARMEELEYNRKKYN